MAHARQLVRERRDAERLAGFLVHEGGGHYVGVRPGPLPGEYTLAESWSHEGAARGLYTVTVTDLDRVCSAGYFAYRGPRGNLSDGFGGIELLADFSSLILEIS